MRCILLKHRVLSLSRLTKSSLFSISKKSHGFGQLSLTRPGHRSNDADNVFFVGASTRPGNGVPLVLIGAKQLAKKVLQKIDNSVQDRR